MLQKNPACAGCALATLGMGFSTPEGTGANGVCVFGEALGEREAAEGLPFRPSGESGALLERCLRRSNLDRSQFTIFNTVNCRPPKNWLENAPWEHAAIKHCRVHRDDVVRRVKPRVLLALGGIATRTLTGLAGPKQGVSLLRGFVLDSPAYGLPVVASYHPSFVNRGNKNLVGVLMRDINLAVQVAKSGVEKYPEDYILEPSVEEAWAWARAAVYGFTEGRSLSYDIETETSIVEVDESELNPAHQRITHIQFTVRKGEAIVFPWGGAYIDVARFLLASSLPKWTWNGRMFDDPVLEAHGVVINGERHDLMNSWHHLQPDLPRGLQFATSFYAPFFQPWKHISADKDYFTYYCAKDADATHRCGEGIFADLKKRGLYDSYIRHVHQLAPILNAVTVRGIPVVRDKQIELQQELQAEIDTYVEEIQAFVPDSIKGVEPKEGYKVLPPEAREVWERFEECRRVKKTGSVEILSPKKVREAVGLEKYNALVTTMALETGMQVKDFGGELRLCRINDFNAGSAQQMITYLKYKRYKVPTTQKEGKETTAEIELQRLYNHTKDPVIERVLKTRKRAKMISAFCESSWVPGPDGRVHPKFGFLTGTGQLTARSPNSTQFPKHGPLAKKARRMIAAAHGHKLIELDFKAFHAKTLALEARDLDYMRLADKDIHSYVTAHFLRSKLRDAKSSVIQDEHYRAFAAQAEIDLMRESEGELKERLADLDGWMKLPDDELSARLAWVGKNYKPVRNFQAKRAILGIGFGMGVRKLFDMNKESFGTLRQAEQLSEILRTLFPRIFKWQDEVRREAHQQGWLMSRHNHIRYFWEVFKYDPRTGRWVPGESSEEAIAFRPANDAHGHFRDCLLAAEERGYLEKYRLLNLIHDSWTFECPDALVDECIENVSGVMSMRSRTLVDSLVAPEGFLCSVDASVGREWSDMQEVKLEKVGA